MASLKELAVKGVTWTIVGYGASQLLRLGSNLLLTRLLFPEVFGLSALINTFMLGLQMFSDVGIGPSIIQNDRGDDPVFLNTAWTIQIFRGFALWICACIGAWPFASFYGEPQLGKLIVVAGLVAVISGFNSTGLFTANRHLRIKPLVLIEFCCQVGAIFVMIVWAVMSPTVWVVVVGSLVAALLKMFASHIFLSEITHKLTWDKQSFHSLISFGRWIFVSTILGFFINNADKLILGKLFSISELGVYSIAAMMAKLVGQVYSQLSNQVLFPVYRKIKNVPIHELQKKVAKIRIAMVGSLLPCIWCLVIFGPKIIEILYDQRYQNAGWMLQVLSAGLIPVIMIGIGPFYLAVGKSNILAFLIAARAIYYFISIILGYLMFGTVGVIYGIAFHNVFVYLSDIFIMNRFSIWDPKIDIVGIFVSIFVIYFGLNIFC